MLSRKRRYSDEYDKVDGEEEGGVQKEEADRGRTTEGPSRPLDIGGGLHFSKRNHTGTTSERGRGGDLGDDRQLIFERRSKSCTKATRDRITT